MAAVLCGYVLLAVALLQHLGRGLPTGRLGTAGPAQDLAEWYLWHGPHAVLALTNPLTTTLWNPPEGANLMANPSLLGLALPLAPLTLLVGPQASFVVALTLGLAGSAAAWYWLLRRLVPASGLGPAIGGAFCGFAPALVSHADGGDLHLVVTAVIPFIVALVLRPAARERWLRNGSLLGLLFAYQVFVGAEFALLTVLGFALMGLAYAIVRPTFLADAFPAGALRQVAPGLAVAVAVAGVLLAYPLWWMFTGPGHYAGIAGASTTVNGLSSWLGFSAQSFVGTPHVGEQNASFGLPLVVLLAVGAWHLRRELAARVSVIVILLACGLSAAAWLPLGRVPVLSSLTVARLALIAVPFIGLLLALMTAQATRTDTPRPRAEATRVRRYALLAIVAALVPLAPAPLPVLDRPSVPDFFASGVWRQVISPGSTVQAIPLTTLDDGLDSLGWQISADGAFSLVDGSFLGPARSLSATQQRIHDVWASGLEPAVTDADRAQARTDLVATQVDVIVLVERGHWEAVLRYLTSLLGAPPQRFIDVRTWRVADGIAVPGA